MCASLYPSGKWQLYFWNFYLWKWRRKVQRSYHFTAYTFITRGKANSSSSRNPGGRKSRTVAGMGELGSLIDNSLIFGTENLSMTSCSFSLFSNLKASVFVFNSTILENGTPGPRHSCMKNFLFGEMWTLLYEHDGPSRSQVMQEKPRLWCCYCCCLRWETERFPS